MSFFGNFHQVHVGKEPCARTQYDNMNWNQETSTAEKEHDTNYAATTTTTTFALPTTNAEKEDETDSTATTTTATATSTAGSEWDKSITEGLTKTTASDELIYVFGEQRRVKPSRKWKTPTVQKCRKEKQVETKTVCRVPTQILKDRFFLETLHTK